MSWTQLAKVVTNYTDFPPTAQVQLQLQLLGYVTGRMSVDIFEAPAVAQSWFVLNSLNNIAEAEGGQVKDVFKPVQYFRDLRYYPAYNRVRGVFCPEPVVSAVV